MLSNALNFKMLAAVDLRWREGGDPVVAISIFVAMKVSGHQSCYSLNVMLRSDHAGPYFKVLNCDTEYALSLLVRGLECDGVMFKSKRHCERGL